MMHADNFLQRGSFYSVANRRAAPDVVVMDYSRSPDSPIKPLSEEKEKERSRGWVNNRIGKKKKKKE